VLRAEVSQLKKWNYKKSIILLQKINICFKISK
jgi:hypothetical protein